MACWDDEDKFAHGANSWAQDPRLTVHELAMLKVMQGTHGGNGRVPPRIQTFGSTFETEYPKWRSNLKSDPKDEGYNESLANVQEYLTLPENPDAEHMRSNNYENKYQDGTWVESDNHSVWGAVDWKWKRIRKVAHPEPGVAYSFEEWKQGKTDGAVVPPRYSRGQKHNYYDVSLQDTFREKGLQPSYDGGSWHIEGMFNEHIVGIAIYYYDVENTTTSRIRFRQEAGLDRMHLEYDQDDHEPLSEIFGTASLRDEAAVQELGSVATP
ncbi:uncharacterized protein BDZ99DRAFT_577100 [Mytilinidion resinicola]|uniref:DUF4246 domain-containing protein n=1 Tax=Mytilinidion resinicola TaxID=574789 RepID=A0A6A6Y0F2_9PEZI|nr:uncharacterized protein BDZ99DRAFT_577100 [Mytilinidion resinicola]KAF2802129.1 hypothetical protein BDZ99DRAFT_577100 [Mytilinidion resinicola]